MELRYYQKNAIKAVLDCLKSFPTSNPCVEAPTGSGKTPMIATLCDVFHRAGARTLCVAHRKELLEQTADKLRRWSPDVNYSVVSAGLNSRDYSGDVVLAGIQSIYKSSNKLLEYGKVDFLIVDEAHLIPATEENATGMYQTLIQALRVRNPKLRVIGLTATPYRLNSGSVCGDDKILTEIVYKIGVPELIGNKYLSPLINKAPIEEGTTFDFHIERGEFKTSEVDEQFNAIDVVHAACKKIVKMTRNRKSVLLFCCSKGHCRAVADELQKISGEEVGVILGDTPTSERELLIKRFKGETVATTLFGDKVKPVKYLCNVEVLTTGFDAPNVDCVVLLRPTASPGLYCQMAGRGLRLFPGKENCLVLDFGGNIQRFGAVDEVEPPKPKIATEKKNELPKKKTCPICFEVIDVNARTCPACGNRLKCDDFECPRCKTFNDLSANFCVECGFQFKSFHGHSEDFDDKGSIISAGSSNEIPVIKEKVLKVQYYEHYSKRSGKNCLRVDIQTPTLTLTEYVCFEHEGFALQNAFKWWRERTEIRPIPYSVKQAYEIIQSVGVAEPTIVKYLPKKPGQFSPEIIETDVKPLPAPDAYPRTDNPLKARCDHCESESFIYERLPGDCYCVKCALCGLLIYEISRDSFPDENEFQAELDQFQRLGIKFYYPDEGFEEFYQIGKPEASNALDDIPF